MPEPDILDDYMDELADHLRMVPEVERGPILRVIRQDMEAAAREEAAREGRTEPVEGDFIVAIGEVGTPQDVADVVIHKRRELKDVRAERRRRNPRLRFVRYTFLLVAAVVLWAFLSFGKSGEAVELLHVHRASEEPVSMSGVEIFNVSGAFLELQVRETVVVEGDGSVSLTLQGPGGEVAYFFVFDGERRALENRRTITAPAEGEWTVSLAFTDFRGSLDLRFVAVRLRE